MPSIHESPTIDLPEQSAAASVAGRNLELLAHRDGALLLAYRIAGNWADAEDILQDAYVNAVRTQSPLLNGESLRRWFLRITVNTALNFRRSDERRRDRERSAAMLSEKVEATPERRAEERDMQRAVQDEFQKLDEKFRAPISLHYEHGYSYDEAAEILGAPAGSLRAYASQGLKQMRERLEKPARPVTVEVLAAFLAAGIAVKASSALAASIECIVAGNGAAVIAAKSAAPAGMKIFAAAPKAALSLSVALTVASVVIALLCAAGGTFAVVQMQNKVAAAKQAEADALAAVEQQQQNQQVLEQEIQAARAEADALRVRPLVAKPEANLPPPPPVQQGSYIAPADVEALWQDAVELLPRIDAQRDSVQGNWKYDGRTLSVPATGPWNRFALPYAPPEEYDFRIDFTRTAGALDICQIFSVNNANLVWRLNSNNGAGHQFGASKNNPTAAPGTPIRARARCTAIVEVRRGTVSAFLNGKLLKSISIPNQAADADAGPDWRLTDQKLLGVGAWFSGVTFQRIAVREVTGAGSPRAEDAFIREAGGENYWGNARNLMPAKVDLAHSRGGGHWMQAKDGLQVLADESSRVQLDYKPPEEYDLRVVFTRIEGERNVTQILVANGRQVGWKIGAWDVVVLDHAGKFFLDSPSALHLPAHLQNGVRHVSIVSVRKDGIKAYIDGKQYLNLADLSDLALDPAWAIKSADALGIGANTATVTFHAIQVKEISGPGETIAVPEEKRAEKTEF